MSTRNSLLILISLASAPTLAGCFVDAPLGTDDASADAAPSPKSIAIDFTAGKPQPCSFAKTVGPVSAGLTTFPWKSAVSPTNSLSTDGFAKTGLPMGETYTSGKQLLKCRINLQTLSLPDKSTKLSVDFVELNNLTNSYAYNTTAELVSYVAYDYQYSMRLGISASSQDYLVYFAAGKSSDLNSGILSGKRHINVDVSTLGPGDFHLFLEASLSYFADQLSQSPTQPVNDSWSISNLSVTLTP